MPSFPLRLTLMTAPVGLRPRRRGRRPSVVAVCVGALAALLLPPSARAVGTPGCGTFYQDKACREDCGSCGQPCCALEWEIGLLATFSLRNGFSRRCPPPNALRFLPKTVHAAHFSFNAALPAVEARNRIMARVFNASSGAGWALRLERCVLASDHGAFSLPHVCCG